MKRILATFALLLGALHILSAIPAYPGKIKVTQPDGSVITIQVHGDEWLHYVTDERGRVVARGEDGFFRPATKPTAVEREEAQSMRRAARQMQAAARASSLTQGVHRIPVILVAFKDTDFIIQDPQAAFDALLNEEGYSTNGGTGSVRDYYIENSGGRYTPVFDVFGPYVLSNNRSSYVNNAANALVEACKGLNSEVDFSQYDSDGDGRVDMALMYYAGHNQAETGDETTIWPHQSYVSGWNNPQLDGKYLNRYFCTSELKGTGNQMCGIGTTTHEFAHSLGLPDFYDTDYEENGYAGGLYSFSTMCEGAYLNNGRTPPYLNSEERILLGWMEGQTEISQQGTLTIGPVQNEIAYKTPTSVNGEYFVYECRTKTGWDRYIPNGGLLVYHVDKSTAHRAGNQTAYNHWANWEWYNKINAYLDHPCFYLVPAADQSNLQFGYRFFYNDDSGNPVYGFDSSQYPKIPFPGTKRVKTYLPVDWEGVDSDYRFTDITFSNEAVTMTVSYTTTPGVAGRVLNTSVKPVRGATVSLSGSGIQRTAVTDVDGTYAFTGVDLADKTFTVSVTCDGFVPAEESVSVGRKEITLDFYLRKVDEPEEASFRKYDPSASTLPFGDGEASDLAAGILLTADELAPYVGKQLKSISFQLAGNASSTVGNVYVFVEVGGRRKLTQRADRVVFGALNTVNIVAQEFLIPSGSSMYIGYGVVGPSEADPLLVQACTSDKMGYYGIYNGTRPISWNDMSQDGTYYTPVLSATVGEPVQPELGFNHIANPGNGTYAAGDRFELALVQYADDPYTSLSWTFDGQAVQSGSVTLTAGKHLVEAHLTYPDGAVEVIRLTIQAE
ncbi:MAG: M6 family metalloprotease domain-containing protein [Bacteroidales bacterium]|nr:M6 family metalloprotease domain-containing protein [Bacteroidales bacterium]